MMRRGLRRSASRSRVVVALVVAIVSTALSLAAARHPPRLGHHAHRRRHRLDDRRAPRPRPRRLGLGRRRPRAPHDRYRHPRHHGGGGHARPPRPPGHARDGERAGLVVAPRPIRARSRRGSRCFRRYRELVQLGAPRGLRPVPLRRRHARNARTRRSGRPAPARARGGRRRLREARPDRSHTRRPDPADDRPTSSPTLQNQVAPAPIDVVRPVLEAELGGRRRRGVRRVRLGTAGGRLDRPDLPRPPAHRRARGREDATPGHRRRHRARPRRARAARQRRAAAHHVRPGAPVGRDAGAVRDESPGRARLPARSRRDAARWRCCSAPTRRSGSRRSTRELCTQRLLVQERFEGCTVADQAGARRRRHRPERAWPRSCCARRSTRCCASASSTPTRTPGTSSRSRDGTPRPDRLRRGRPARPDPAGGGRRHPRRARSRRDVSLLRDGIERVADVTETVAARAARARVRPAPRRARPRHRSGRPDRCSRTSSRRSPSSASASRPISSSCRARWSRSTARCACSSPELSL